MSIPKGLPERTLGWGVLAWCSFMLGQPDRDDKGSKWVFTDEQALFILWFYAIDEQGKFLYRNGVLMRPKGWGKSPLLAALCCAELLGPVRFSHFDPGGTPIGKPQPSAVVQIAAVSEDQTDNTMTLVGEMLAEGLAQAAYNLDIGLSRIIAPGGRKIIRVTASPKSREGNRPTFIVMDETHVWLPSNNGIELADTLRRNLAKTGCRSIETTNAPVPGMGSVAEASYDAYDKAVAEGNTGKLLFDTREVDIPDIYDREAAFEALRYVYGDSVWIDLERIWDEINDPRTKEHDARRFYFNQRVQFAERWIDEADWDSAKRPGLEFTKRDRFALGLKCVPRKSAAIVASRIEDGALFLVGFWERPPHHPGDWEVPMDEFDATVRKFMSQEECLYLAADPWQMQDYVGRWYADYEFVESFWLNQHLKQAKALDAFEAALHRGQIIHSGEPNLKRHVMNSRRLEKTEGYVLRMEREFGSKYITAAQAAVLAVYAHFCVVEAGRDKPPPDYRLYRY